MILLTFLLAQFLGIIIGDMGAKIGLNGVGRLFARSRDIKEKKPGHFDKRTIDHPALLLEIDVLTYHQENPQGSDPLPLSSTRKAGRNHYPPPPHRDRRAILPNCRRQ
jgi:hypothetical protein